MYISLDILIEEWPAIRISVHTSQPDAPSLVRNVWRKLYSTKGRAFEVFKAVRCCFLTLEWSMCRVFDIQQPKIAPIPICQYDPTLIRPAIRFRSWLSCTRIDVGTSRIVIPLSFYQDATCDAAETLNTEHRPPYIKSRISVLATRHKIYSCP